MYFSTNMLLSLVSSRQSDYIVIMSKESFAKILNILTPKQGGFLC